MMPRNKIFQLVENYINQIKTLAMILYLKKVILKTFLKYNSIFNRILKMLTVHGESKL